MYEKTGIDGLCDGRGRIKPVEEMTDVEKLQAENRLPKAPFTQQNILLFFVCLLDREHFTPGLLRVLFHLSHNTRFVNFFLQRRKAAARADPRSAG